MREYARSRSTTSAETLTSVPEVHLSFNTFILSVVLAIQPAGLASVNLRQSQAVQPSTQPQVSMEFQPEVSQITATGMRLKEATEASLDGLSKHLAAIFERTGAKDP